MKRPIDQLYNENRVVNGENIYYINSSYKYSQIISPLF